nr:PREDICTED: proteasome inhibitor PI31 subunit isoform X2 [Latimeria chalumnae]|eukprot:XP_014348289.1 PREDICTED: proteasome inhibitor PI31 subunit isoform X2 [Latimeria chalumnae]
MAGLEILYNNVLKSISYPQDSLVCFIHWEIITWGYKCVGIGDQARGKEKKSELLPAGWNKNKELYTLRYRSNDGNKALLLKAVIVDSTAILNVMCLESEKVADLTVNLNNYIDSTRLQDVDRVFKNAEELRSQVKSEIFSILHPIKEKMKKGSPRSHRDRDPLRVPSRSPLSGMHPDWPSPLAPFATGGEDLDPFRPDPDHLPPPGYDDMFM